MKAKPAKKTHGVYRVHPTRRGLILRIDHQSFNFIIENFVDEPGFPRWDRNKWMAKMLRKALSRIGKQQP